MSIALKASSAPDKASSSPSGKLRNRPWVEDTSLLIRPTVILNLSVDHRVADGITAAVFLERIAGIIENPSGVGWNE